MKTPLTVFMAILCWTTSGKPEVVQFKNGDQLTGQWVRIQAGTLTFKSETVGEVSIPLSGVKSFTSPDPAVVLLKDDHTLRGSVTLSPSGDWEVATEEAPRQVAAASVQAIYRPSEYDAKKTVPQAKPWQNWKGSGNFGYNLVRGDQQAGTLSIGVNAMRRQPVQSGVPERLRTNYFMTMLFASTRSLSGPRITANSFTSGVRQDFLFTSANFFFLMAQFDHIQAQSLELRQNYGLGIGHDVVRTPRAVINFLGGTTLVREKFQDRAGQGKSEGLVGERFSIGLSDRVKFEHHINFYPSLSDGGRYRFDTNSTLSTRVSSRLSLTTGFTDRYLSRPLPGRQKNEFVLTTGFGLNF